MSFPNLKIETDRTDPSQIHADWLIIGYWDSDMESGPTMMGSSSLHQTLKALHTRGDWSNKRGEVLPIYSHTGILAERVLFVGLGKPSEASRLTLHETYTLATRRLTTKPTQRLAYTLPNNPPGMPIADVVLGMCSGIGQGIYGPGIRKSQPTRFAPTEIKLLTHDANGTQSLLERANTEIQAVGLARELVNLPACDLYPESFAAIAIERATAAGLNVEVLDETQIEAQRMGALLGVARGSDRPPRLVVLQQRVNDGPTLGLVGKGVTFDSGGLSLKTSDQMVDMKGDMAGAAATLAATLAIAQLKLPYNLVTVIPLVENMPSGKALKLGDVLKARNGKTIEILNTDAEGRLILADALDYAIELGATQLVDLATLTGACMVALGTETAGLFTNHTAWGNQIQQAATKAGERVWPMPLDAHFEEALKSNVADLKNVAGSRWGGAIVAAKFLEQFVGSTQWTHLDIAGPAWAESETANHDPGGTGFGVRTLVQLVDDLSTVTA
jgi:leucyl aminopeptidase